MNSAHLVQGISTAAFVQGICSAPFVQIMVIAPFVQRYGLGLRSPVLVIAWRSSQFVSRLLVK